MNTYMYMVSVGFCTYLAGCSSSCPKFVDYQSHTVYVKAINATLPVGTPVPVKLEAGEVRFDPRNRDASEEIQRSDLSSTRICSTIRDMPEGPEKDKLRKEYFSALVDLLKGTKAASTNDIDPQTARFGITLGWQLGRYEFTKDSPIPEARAAATEIEEEIKALLKLDGYPQSLEGQSADQVIRNILLYYGTTNLKKHASVLVGIAALRATMIGASHNPRNNEEMKRLARSAIEEIDASVILKKEEFFEALVAERPRNVPETLSLLAKAKLR